MTSTKDLLEIQLKTIEAETVKVKSQVALEKAKASGQ